LKRFEKPAFGRLILGIKNGIVGVFYIFSGKRFSIMEAHIRPKIKEVCLCIDHVPAFGQLGPQPRLFVSAEKGIVDQTTDAHRIGIGGVTRIEIERVAFDTDDEIAARAV